MLNTLLPVKDRHPTESAILNSAMSLFLLAGEDVVTISRLIQTAGISRSVFYHHFSGKEDLYAAILLSDEFGFGDLLQRHRRSPDLTTLMRECLKYRIQHLDKHQLLMRLEARLAKEGTELDRYRQWQRLKRNHMALFTEIAAEQMQLNADSDELRFLYGLIWTLADGLATLRDNELYHELIQDRRGFSRYLMDAVALMGNKPNAT
ncbi:TetR/AcrR family transcriptional regulator [Saccharospirillum mangrovi]|uniref:TetR/AcrR family transcriptional regulator n=1 Tax=Saccharospirillum mangrovi TaxID=2161747 RepID=UPI000D3977BB|nr:TetR/AcrR family transcriptional regulator [Saccharospirillum mangrovi]